MSISNYKRKLGQFFTPDYIANFMLNRTLDLFLNHLKRELGDAPNKNVTNLVFEKIKSYKILDPALGEGIFLELILKKIVEFCIFFNSNQDYMKIENPFEFTLKNNIYGVEFDQKALIIAEKRLSSIINPKKEFPEPFYNLRLGNSLKWPNKDEKQQDDEHDFYWELEFPEVINKKHNSGFDLIIGNPPYIRIHKQDNKLKDFIRSRYQSPMKDFDVYIIFIELAIELLKKGGLLCYITSDKFLTRLYAKKIRELMLRDLYFKEFIDISRCKESFKIDAYPLIFIAEKNQNNNNNFVYYQIIKNLKYNLLKFSESDEILRMNLNQADYYQNENLEFYLNSRKFQEIIVTLEKLDKLGNILSENVIFCGTPRAKDYHSWKNYIIEDLKDVPNNLESLKYIVCRNMQPFNINWGIKINSLRNFYHTPYFVFQNQNLSSTRWKTFKHHPKVLIRANDTRITAALDEEGYVCNGIYGIIQDSFEPEKLVGILNSELLNFYFIFKNASIRISGNYYSINGMHLKNLPIAQETIKNEKKLVEIVNNIINIRKKMSLKENNALMDNYVKNYEELNNIIYDLYGINDKNKKEIKKFLKDPNISKFHL